MLLLVLAVVLLSAAPAQTDDAAAASAAQPISVSETHADDSMRQAQQRVAANQQNAQIQRAAIQVSGPAAAPAPSSATEEAASPAAPGAAPASGPFTAAPAEAPAPKSHSKKKKATTQRLPAFPGLVGTTGGSTPSTSAAATFPGRQEPVRPDFPS